MTRILLLCLALLSSIAYSDGFNDAVAAYDEENYDEAFRIFSNLAELGHVDALNNLGALYQTGKGTVTNYVYAANSYKEAAMMGHIDAAYNYSNLARLGIGIERNLSEAYAWAIIAARHGASDMVAYRGTLKSRLKPEELNRAHEEAKEVLEPLSQQELALGWLLPNEVKLTELSTMKSMFTHKKEISTLPKEILSLSGEIKSEAVPEGFTSLQIKKDTEENIKKTAAPISSYQAIQRTYPTQMNLTGQTIYRPLMETIDATKGTLLRPRREIPAQVSSIPETIEVEASLKTILQSIANSYKVHINFVIVAIQKENPKAFEKDPPLRLKDPNYRLKIPTYQQVKPEHH